MAGTITYSGQQITGAGTKNYSGTWPCGVVDERLDLTLASGDNVINIPLGAQGAFVIPPAGNTGASAVVLKLKNSAGDSGTPISGYVASELSWDGLVTPPSSFIINASASLSGVVVDFR